MRTDRVRRRLVYVSAVCRCDVFCVRIFIHVHSVQTYVCRGRDVHAIVAVYITCGMTRRMCLKLTADMFRSYAYRAANVEAVVACASLGCTPSDPAAGSGAPDQWSYRCLVPRTLAYRRFVNFDSQICVRNGKSAPR